MVVFHDGSVPQGETFEVATSVQVKNERTRQSCYISSFEFLEHRSIFQAEVFHTVTSMRYKTRLLSALIRSVIQSTAAMSIQSHEPFISGCSIGGPAPSSLRQRAGVLCPCRARSWPKASSRHSPARRGYPIHGADRVHDGRGGEKHFQ